MNKLVAMLVLCLSAAACGGSQKPAGNTAQELDMLITLYTEDRAKFVIQKQSMEQNECDRAQRLAAAAREKEAAANMTPGDSSTITQVRMELDQAEKTCLAK